MSSTKQSSWFRWVVGSIIALIAAGGGLVALLKYLDQKYTEQGEWYKQALKEWENFAPESISRGTQTVTLRGLDRFDLETGRVTSNPGLDNSWDLLFGCWPQAYESLRAGDGVAWSDLGVVDFNGIRYRDIRDASFRTNRNETTGYPDLYYAHKSNVPGSNYTYAIKTPLDHVAKVQIVRYESVDPNPNVCRNVVLCYEVFPIVPDPPKPERP